MNNTTQHKIDGLTDRCVSCGKTAEEIEVINLIKNAS
jgi:hypothetical protein